MQLQRNPVGWFEIPVQDMERAKNFYRQVLGYSLEDHQMADLAMSWFPMAQGLEGATGSLIRHQDYKPSNQGVVIYFTSPSGDVAIEESKVESAGGKVIQSKYAIGEHGFVSMIEDSEGNRIGLHSIK